MRHCKHIILVTDGQPFDPLYENPEEKTGGYGEVIKRYHDTDGITWSIAAIGGNASTISDLQEAADVGGGKFYGTWDVQTLPLLMREDLNRKEIKEAMPGPFQLSIHAQTNVTSGIEENAIPLLDGFYGTALKEGASAPLFATYAPLYAQWKFGEGRVGSFMCDLNGYWSKDFLESAVGQKLIFNMIDDLLPVKKSF